MDAIITAAGKNSRMIDDFKQRNKKPIHKLKLEINNKPILIHTIEKVANADINNITIALGHHKDEIYSLLEEYDLLDTVNIKINEDVNVGLSKTIENCIKDNLNEYYLFTAADQPTISTETINKLINTLKNASNPKNTISILARRKIGKLDSAEGLGMPFCCYGNLLYKYLANEDGNLNPILRKMIKNNVEFYGTPSRNELELKNINHYAEYEYIKEKLEK
ncbi:NTP transferase domain-containing protein [uncultured Methanosphaera sp.]|uniref:nucleotidyltransferase family protein n=1 Tax=uncultured Methanosphaera sp. TaxID=262501 RepID=UPI0025DAF27F|nr:NTP transferase domain-containing protein [uncultured Methanosphaera sp.]